MVPHSYLDEAFITVVCFLFLVPVVHTYIISVSFAQKKEGKDKRDNGRFVHHLTYFNGLAAVIWGLNSLKNVSFLRGERLQGYLDL